MIATFRIIILVESRSLVLSLYKRNVTPFQALKAYVREREREISCVWGEGVVKCHISIFVLAEPVLTMVCFCYL